MTGNFSETKYAELLTETIPVAIETRAEYKRAQEIRSRLIRVAEPSPEQIQLHRLITALMSNYEAKIFPAINTEPRELLETLLEERGMKHKELLPIFKSEGIISDICSGKRRISKNKAEELGAFFNVSYRVFL
jgi:HTH-type transcriptional regulator/antitoxin HigA